MFFRPMSQAYTTLHIERRNALLHCFKFSNLNNTIKIGFRLIFMRFHLRITAYVIHHIYKLKIHTGTEITGLAHQLGYEREVIRIWFCNKRQALKNTVRMMSKGMV